MTRRLRGRTGRRETGVRDDQFLTPVAADPFLRRRLLGLELAKLQVRVNRIYTGANRLAYLRLCVRD